MNLETMRQINKSVSLGSRALLPQGQRQRGWGESFHSHSLVATLLQRRMVDRAQFSNITVYTRV